MNSSDESIYEMRGHMEIFSNVDGLTSEPPESLVGINGFVGPIGSGGEREAYVEFSCPGHLNRPKYLTVYVVVRYHDIFNEKRETRLAYAIDNDSNIYRQDALTESNKSL